MQNISIKIFNHRGVITMSVKYTLLNYKDKSIVFQKTIKSPYTATVGDAFAGVKRLQLANEGSTKENIYRLLKEFQTTLKNDK